MPREAGRHDGSVAGFNYGSDPGEPLNVLVYEGPIIIDRNPVIGSGELIAQDSITCPALGLTDFFDNQSECIQYVNEHPQTVLTRAMCREGLSGDDGGNNDDNENNDDSGNNDNNLSSIPFSSSYGLQTGRQHQRLN
jgi:hypothetical protein